MNADAGTADQALEQLRLHDGRVVEFAVRGPQDGPVVFLQHGMPGSAVPMDTVSGSAVERGYRVITYSRAGYGASTPVPGRAVAGAVEDGRVLLDHLGVRRCLVAGWSAGGPYALATGAADPQRVSGVLLIASFAPYDAKGLEFVAGMGVQNAVLFGAAVQGEQALRTAVLRMGGALRGSGPADLAAAMGSLLPAVDSNELTSAYGADNAANVNHGLARGDAGWLGDLHALTSPWGFDLGSVVVPVDLWHGSLDRMVPVAHARWMAEHLPTARPHLRNHHGHLSIGVGSLGDKLDRLITRTSLTRPV